MFLKVIAISLIGIGVVFAFLIFIYLLLLSFKYLFKQKETEGRGKIQERKDLLDKDIAEEELVSILTAVNYYHQDKLKSEKIIINQIRRVE